MRRHFISVVTVGILVLLLAGGSGATGLRAADSKAIPPAAPSGDPGVPLKKPLHAEALPPAPIYEYDATGKSDPFEPFMETDPVMKSKKEEDLRKKMLASKGRPILPLQQVDIDQLRLVGIAGNDLRRTAIVEDGIAKKTLPPFCGDLYRHERRADRLDPA